MALLPSGWSPAQPAVLEDPILRVVILHNADYFLPASVLMDGALRETMTRESKRPIHSRHNGRDSRAHV